MVENEGRVTGIVARPGLADPIDKNFRIVVELGHDRLRERRRRDAPVMGPDGAAKHLAPHEGAAALVGNLEAPAAHVMALPAGPAIAARSEEHTSELQSRQY